MVLVNITQGSLPNMISYIKMIWFLYKCAERLCFVCKSNSSYTDYSFRYSNLKWQWLDFDAIWGTMNNSFFFIGQEFDRFYNGIKMYRLPCKVFNNKSEYLSYWFNSSEPKDQVNFSTTCDRLSTLLSVWKSYYISDFLSGILGKIFLTKPDTTNT